MTIYKPKPSDGKGDAQKSSLKAAVVIDDKKLLATRPAAETVRVVQARRRRSVALLGCCILLIFIVIVVTAAGGYFLFNRLTRKMHDLHYQDVVEKAQFRYFEYQRADQMHIGERRHFNLGERRRVNLGSFVENIQFENDQYMHERLDVPPILESRRSTVVHDFEKNMTAIVDRDRKRCFIMPLNRTAVQPPRSFLDLIVKYKTGYYLPDAEVVRDNYRVQLPAVQNTEELGFYIWFDCRFFHTYRLVRDETEPRWLSKRSACEEAGETYCLGSGGASQMLCVKLTSCT